MPGKSLLLGVSTGGSSALEIASRNPQNYLGVVAVPGRIKSSEPIPFLQGLPVFLRIAERDYFRWQKDLPDMAQFLTNAGAKVDAALVAGGRHTFTINWQELDPWLDSLK
jgi:predicted esterase